MKTDRPYLIAMDLEGVLIPEIWIAFAEKTGIEELKRTTRDEPDYDKLMQQRLDILKENNLKISDIQEVIETLDPLPGAAEFLNWINENYQAVILSDTFYEFAKPLMKKLGWPTLFCNSLEIAEDGTVADYTLRMQDGKRHAVLSFRNLNFQVIAMGDSYNDTTMLGVAEKGILFTPSDNVRDEFPQFDVAYDYDTVKKYITEFTK